ncbi:MAG: MFS transporter [Legionellales bacterium RIFCSPHIGHO2_12_FULL_42_9]|nr:MAG: MFS transporter [Legionellales bacterium RIFCSPHIGHO2_12_FULL_42_9]
MSHNQTKTNSSITTKSYLPWLVWGLGCLFYFYEFLLQVSLGVMSNELMRDFAVTSQTLGLLSGVYFYSYAGMQIPGGVLMDRFGPHRLLTIATAVCALSTLAFGLTDSFLTACIARLMIGFGSAFAAVGTFKLAANWFPAQRFAFMTGLTVTIGMLGAIGGEGPLALFIDYFGWRESMQILGAFGLIIALLISLIAKDAPGHSKAILSKHAEENFLIVSLLELIKNKQLWLVASYGGLMYMSTPVFCGLWGVPFLMYKLHLTKAIAANYVSLILVGWAIASPLWGLFSNRVGARKPPMLIGAVGALCTSIVFIYAPLESGVLIQILLFAFGVFSSGFLPSFAAAKELCNKRYVATSLSFMNMMNMLGIALAQPLIGYILDRCWQGEIVDKVRVYPMEAYHIALIILPAGILIALLLLPFIKETHCQNVND